MIDGSPASREISLTVRWLWRLSSGLGNSDSTVSTFLSVYAHCVCRCPDACGLLRTSPAACWCFVQKLCYKLSSIVTFTFYTDFWSTFCLLYWIASKLPSFLVHRQNSRYFDVWFERRKVNKKSKSIWKLIHENFILETFEYFCQIPSKSILTISSYTVSKLGRFLTLTLWGITNCTFHTRLNVDFIAINYYYFKEHIPLWRATCDVAKRSCWLACC